MKDIIFFHKELPDFYANQWNYLEYVLEITKKYNPKARIHFICDKPLKVEGVIYANYLEYHDSEISLLDKIFSKLGTTENKFHGGNVLRWIYIYNYCLKNRINSFVQLDTDVTLFQDISKINHEGDVATNIVYDYMNCAHVNTDIICPHCQFIMNIDILKSYKELVLDEFQDKDSKIYQIHNTLVNCHKYDHGIGDMFCWGLLCRNDRSRFTNIKGVHEVRDIPNWITREIYCTALEDPEGLKINDLGEKDIIRKGPNFYGILDDKYNVKLNCIHWHGVYKQRIEQFYKDNF